MQAKKENNIEVQILFSYFEAMDAFSRKHSRLIFAMLIAGISVTFLDQTILPIALPTIQRELGLGSDMLYWIVNIYMLAAAIFFMAGGKLSDMIGHRRGFLYGIFFFALASLFCALSHSGVMLLVGRFFQGASVSLIVPSSMAIVLEEFPSSAKGKIMGMLMGFSSVFLLLGPFLGGLFTQYLSWRFIFYVNLPLTLFSFIGAYFILERRGGHKEQIDLPGFMLFSISLLSVIYPIMQVHEWGWSSVKFWVLILTAAVFIGLLYVLSKRDEHPFLDLSLFQIRKFAGAIFIVFFTQMTISLPVFWPIFMQKILYLSPALTGTLALISILPVVIVAPLAGRLADKYGSYTPSKYGFLSLAFCLIWLIFAFPTFNIISIVFGMSFLGIGITMIASCTGIYGIGAVDGKKRGVASGMYSTSRYAGLSVGIAIVSPLIATFQRIFFKINLQYHADTTKLDADRLLTLYEQNEDAIHYLHTLSPNTQDHITEGLRSATAYGFSIAMMVLLVAVIIGFATLNKFFGKMEIKESVE